MNPRHWILQMPQDYLNNLDTPQKRFDAAMKWEWAYWSTQRWNNKFTGIPFDQFCEKNSYLLELGSKDYTAIWIQTGVYPDPSVKPKESQS